MGRTTVTLLEGWGLVATVATALAATATLLLAPAVEVETVRLLIRLTARTSLALFLAAFTASTLGVLVPGSLTGWQRRNRRYLGLSFAVSHLVHAVSIAALFVLSPAVFWSLTSLVSIAFGGSAYLFIVAMAATSSNAAQRWMGPARWRLLHGVGIWFVWATFLAGYAKRIPNSGWYAVGATLLLLALVPRVAAWLAGRRAAGVRGSA